MLTKKAGRITPPRFSIRIKRERSIMMTTIKTAPIEIGPKQTHWFQRFIQREATAFYGFISLWLLGFVFLQVFPMVATLVASFTNYNGFDLSSTAFIGLSNYREAFQSPDAWYTMRQTFIYTLLSIPLSIVVALGLAILLNKKIPGRGAFRTAFYLPTMIPIGATALVFKSILDGNFGFLNLFISLFRKGTVINWINNYGLYCLVAIAVWGCGTMMIIFLAGLQNIPEELLEAAEIDGANKGQIFLHITWPLLTPITYFQIMLAIINALQMFLPASVMAQAHDPNSFWNPWYSMFVFPGYALQQILSFQRFGYGTALLWILFVIILAIALIVRKTSTSWVHYAVEQEGRSGKQ
ncbi:MAG: carbohydrate ABC transporter permease [Bacteroidota bacterium]